MSLQKIDKKDNFLQKEYVKQLNYFENECKELEKKISRLGIFATKKQKENLKKLQKIYEEKLTWYGRQMDYEYFDNLEELLNERKKYNDGFL